MRWIRDREQRHLRSAASERIQLYFCPLNLVLLPVVAATVPLPPGSQPVHGRTDRRTDRQADGTVDEEGRVMDGRKEGKRAGGSW